VNGSSVRCFTVADQLSARGVVQVAVRLSWRESDPYAVELVFLVGDSGCDDVGWFLARDLLARGLHTSSGVGDIHVRPDGECCPDCGQDVTVIELDAPSGCAVFEFLTAELAEFLDATYDQVPPGAESLVIDIDAEIALLLEGENR